MPRKMKKILCPTDFTEATNGAVAYAAKLAHALHCELTLLHVDSVFDFSPSLLETSASSSMIATQRLKEQCRDISQIFKIPCNAEVVTRMGRLSTVIKEEARDHDLIVMGTDGSDDLYQSFWGSNTYNAIVRSQTPLLLVPAGFIYTEIKTMVYGYNYLRERDLPIHKLIPFVKALNCKLTILQVMEEAYSQEADEDLQELQFILTNNEGDSLHYEFDTIRSSDVPRSIDSYMRKNQPDVLALCSKHRSVIEQFFHKSVIKHISAITDYPVYVFHQ